MRFQRICGRARVVKGSDSKSVAVSARRFESFRPRLFFFIPRVPTGARPRQKLKKDTCLRSSGAASLVAMRAVHTWVATDQQMEVVVKVPQVDIVPGEGDGGFWQRQSDWYDDGSASN